MHWAGVKSEKYLHLSDSHCGSSSHPGSATSDRSSSSSYTGAETAINDLQDILRASNELRHEREKFVVGNIIMSRTRKLHELDEVAQVRTSLCYATLLCTPCLFACLLARH